MNAAKFSQLGEMVVDGRWLLTHATWKGSTETGVRDLNDRDERGRPRFELVQHGWPDWQLAGSVIARSLRKGWTVQKVSDVLDRIVRDRSK